MRKEINNLIEFNKAFGIEYGSTPRLIGLKQQEFRCNLLQEEFDEYKTANSSGDLVEVADALGDMLYILLGTILEHGMQDVIEDVFNTIHSSNMSKLGEDGRPIINGDQTYDPRKPIGKVLKGERYWSPQFKIEEILCKKM